MIAGITKPPAVLIVNPNAGRSSEAQRDEVIAALRHRFDLTAFATAGRDTGIQLARDAVAADASLVIAFGGDGHVNEVANGVAGSDASLGIVPGGTMNVFARSLGIPLDAMAAVDLLRRKAEATPRHVPLGRMDDRYFTFSAGCGFDAEAAERVERYVPAKRHFGELFFYWSAFRVLAGSYRHRNPTMTLEGPFGRVPVAMVIACNAGPYAYLGGRQIELAPRVRLEGGLDVFALRTMRLEALPLYAWRAVVTRRLADHRDAFYEADLTSFAVNATTPFHRHVDGEPLSPATSARFTLAPDVLKVIA